MPPTAWLSVCERPLEHFFVFSFLVVVLLVGASAFELRTVPS